MNTPFLSISTNRGLKFLKEKNILYATSEGNYTNLFLLEGTQLVSTKNLKELTTILSTNDFFRIHHSHIINLNHLVSYENGKGNYVVMKDGKKLDVSKRRLSDFLSLFKKI